MSEQSDTQEDHPVLDASGMAALAAVLVQTLRGGDAAFLQDLRENTDRLYNHLVSSEPDNPDVLSAIETLRWLEEYLDVLQQKLVENRDGIA